MSRGEKRAAATLALLDLVARRGRRPLLASPLATGDAGRPAHASLVVPAAGGRLPPGV